MSHNDSWHNCISYFVVCCICAIKDILLISMLLLLYEKMTVNEQQVNFSVRLSVSSK